MRWSGALQTVVKHITALVEYRLDERTISDSKEGKHVRGNSP